MAAAELCACSVLLPAHSRSELREGERVCLERLEHAALEPYRAAYEAVFGAAPRLPGGAGALESAVRGSGLALDAVSAALEREASRTEAQFAVEASFDPFWIGPPASPRRMRRAARGSRRRRSARPTARVRLPERSRACAPAAPCPGELLLQQRYPGIRLRRWVEGESEPVFPLVLGIHPAYDQQMFRVAPLLFRSSGAKAKVLSDERWSWLPPFVLARLFASPGHAIDTTVNLELDAYWKDRHPQLKAAKVAAVQLSFPQYDVARAPLLENPGGGSGWILAISVSSRPESR